MSHVDDATGHPTPSHSHQRRCPRSLRIVNDSGLTLSVKPVVLNTVQRYRRRRLRAFWPDEKLSTSRRPASLPSLPAILGPGMLRKVQNLSTAAAPPISTYTILPLSVRLSSKARCERQRGKGFRVWCGVRLGATPQLAILPGRIHAVYSDFFRRPDAIRSAYTNRRGNREDKFHLPGLSFVSQKFRRKMLIS